MGGADISHTSANSGLVMLFYGEGWAKSTASYGYTLRAIGRGWPASIIQFVKGANWNTAECSSASRIGIEWFTFSNSLTWGSADPVELAEEAWQLTVKKLHAPTPSLIVLDEVTNAISNGWISESKVAQGIRERSEHANVILTGKYPNDVLFDVADVVTRFEKEKDAGPIGILEH